MRAIGVFAIWAAAHVATQCLLVAPIGPGLSFETAASVLGFFMFWWALWGGALFMFSVAALAGEQEAVSRTTGWATLLFTLSNWLMGVAVFLLRRPEYIPLWALVAMAWLSCVLLAAESYLVQLQQLKGLETVAAKEIEREKRVRNDPDGEKED